MCMLILCRESFCKASVHNFVKKMRVICRCLFRVYLNRVYSPVILSSHSAIQVYFNSWRVQYVVILFLYSILLVPWVVLAASVYEVVDSIPYDLSERI